MAPQPGAGDEAIALRIQHDVDNHGVADADATLLLGIGQQQVLGQAPVEEGAGAGMQVDDAQGGEIAGHGQRTLGGGDQAILGIAVDKDLEGRVRGRAGRHLAHGQQDLAMFTAVEVGPVRGTADHRQHVESAERGHGIAARETGKRKKGAAHGRRRKRIRRRPGRLP